MAKIFNISLETGIFLNDWKIARVVPIYKARVKRGMSDCRPISVLSAVAGVFEKIVYNQLYDHLVNNSLITKYQSGLHKLHSTITGMLKNMTGWFLDMGKWLYIGVVLFD